MDFTTRKGAEAPVMSHLTANRVAWGVTGVATLVASIAGVVDVGLYDGVVAGFLIPGAYAQDLISTVAAVGLLVLALMAGGRRPKLELVALGLLGYLFYAYGIYVIERTYNEFYLLCMAIFTLSFWSLVYGCLSIRGDVYKNAQLSSRVRLASAMGSLLQPLVFYPLWIGMLLPLMASGDQVDSLYSIFILDLCFIMPAFLILAFQMFRRRGIGLVLAPPLYVLGFTLIFSLALAELVKPRFGEPIDGLALLAATSLSALFLVLGGLHLAKLRVRPDESRDHRQAEEALERR